MTVEKVTAFGLALLCYLVAREVFRSSGRHVLALPVFVAVLLVLGFCAALGVAASDFARHTVELKWGMDVAVVAMAVPLHQVCRRLRGALWSLLIGLLVASVLSVAGVLFTGWMLRMPWDISAAVAPKAATMPVALSLVSGGAAYQAMAVASVFLTGLVGSLLTPVILRRVEVFDERIHAFSLGVSAHAIGLVRAQAQHPEHLDLAVVGMCGNALATAVLCSVFFF